MEEACVLVVDDEPKLVRLVSEVLTATGFKVLSTGKGENAIKMAAIEQPDLILLDIVLAGEIDGYEVARRVREFSEVPIVMLTAKTRERDLLRGFNSGADDYLTKPFSSKELLARLRAVLKRARHDATVPEETELICGEMRMDLARRRVTMGDHVVHLSRTEYNLLFLLAKNRNKVLLHHKILSEVWGAEYRDDLEYLRAYIRYLRKKLEPDPSNPKMILTSQGVGYMLACPNDSE
jgi:two-component system KDP operon response regulator KdpE